MFTISEEEGEEKIQMKETFEGPPTISERGVKTKSIFVPVVVPMNPLNVPT